MKSVRHVPGRVLSTTTLVGSPRRGFTVDRPVGLDVTADLVGFLAELIAEMAARGVAERWDPATWATLAAPTAPDGRRWSTWGWKAATQADWDVSAQGRVLLGSSRVRYMAREEMMRSLRAAAARDQVVRSLVATWFDDAAPADERDRLLAERRHLLAGVSPKWVTNIRRRVAKFERDHGRLPTGLCELEPPARPGAQVPLASAADGQFAHLSPGDRPGRVHLDIMLPTTAGPRSRGGWVWHRLVIAVRPDVDATALTLPTLQVRDGVVRASFAVTRKLERPALPSTGPITVLGLDWGVRRLLTGVVVDATSRGGGRQVATVGPPLFFDPSGLITQWHRLRRQRELLWAKIVQLETLGEGRTRLGRAPDPAATAKLQVLRVEHARVCAKQRHLGTEVANVIARLVVHHAEAAGAHVVAVEDLATLEPPRHGSKRVRTRISQQLRGQVFTKISDACAEAGITFTSVRARGTSSTCVACGGAITHTATPAGGPGYAWGRCTPCGRHQDRDVLAAHHIATRGAGTYLDRRRAARTKPRSAFTAPTVSTKTKKRKLASARIRFGRSDRRLPPPAPLHRTRRGTAVPHTPTPRRAPCGPVTAAPTPVHAGAGTPFAAATSNAATSQGALAAVGHPGPPGHRATNVVRPVAPGDGTRYAYRSRMKVSPTPFTGSRRTRDPGTPN